MTEFNELEYRQKLIDQGTDQNTAFDLARRYAEAQGRPPAQGAVNSQPAPAAAPKQANAKKKTSAKPKAEPKKKPPTRADIALTDASARIMTEHDLES